MLMQSESFSIIVYIHSLHSIIDNGYTVYYNFKLHTCIEKGKRSACMKNMHACMHVVDAYGVFFHNSIKPDSL